MDPEELFAGFKKIDSFGLELVGIYHSHPAGPAEPSLKDMAEAISPDIVYVILAPDQVGGGKIKQKGRWTAIAWQVRGFLIYRDRMTEIELNCG
jgi:proteasome lid subunit RPN8/RPN11